MQSTYISELFSISLRDLPIPPPDRKGEGRGKIFLPGRTFDVLAVSDGAGGGELSFRCLETRSFSRYDLEERRSNLPSGGSYFLIRSRGRYSRKLYLCGKIFVPRWSLPLEYESQARSKRWREIDKDGVWVEILSLFEKNRKVHYRGRLTPFGRTLSRYSRQLEFWNNWLREDPRIRRVLDTWESVERDTKDRGLE